MRTHVYIDGFNFYYGAVRNTEFKWLNFRQLAETIFPEDDILKIYYFTARINPHCDDLNRSNRQAAYFRALNTISGLEICYGEFRSRTRYLPLAHPVPELPKYVEVRYSEEKETDDTLATRPLLDGFNEKYEQAVVISNDGDFVSALKCVKECLGLRVTLVNPDLKSKRSSPQELADAATYVKRLRMSHPRKCQFPNAVEDSKGLLTKPDNW